MDANISPLKTALRVLVAVVKGRAPDPADVAALRCMAPAAMADAADDELACGIIQRETKRGVELRYPSMHDHS